MKFNNPFSKKRSNIQFLQATEATDLFVAGYSQLSDNPEVKIAVDKIADLVSNMTIHLMENSESGDKRIKNELSRKIDIDPYSFMTRKTWVYNLVYSMLLPGDGNAFILPIVKNGKLLELKPLEPSQWSIIKQEVGYGIRYKSLFYESDELLHFAINPNPDVPYQGTGYRVALRDITHNLKQATKTKNSFMSGQYMPNIIVKVDALSEDLASEAGREQIKQKYLGESKPGEPWIIPAELLEVQQIKPLSLKDIAINESVDIDKKTVAGLIGVPSFFLGVGEFDKDEYNNFINTKIMSIAKTIEQTLTKGLVLNPNHYFKCNARSLFAYDIETLGNLGMNLYSRGLALGNEARDLVGMPPIETLNELVILENYIPKGMMGDQKKLNKEVNE